jgi:hypothetical protein
MSFELKTLHLGKKKKVSNGNRTWLPLGLSNILSNN